MRRFVFTALLLGLALSASAETIASFNTTPNGGPWDDIHFYFVNANDTSKPYSLGGLYVRTEAYFGKPADLSSSTGGYLGFTNDNIREFSNLTLNANTKYYFYMDTALPLGTVMSMFETGDGYAGGEVYGGGGAANTFGTGPADMLFKLTGDQVSAAPEPGTLALMAGAAGLLAAFRRRRI